METGEGRKGNGEKKGIERGKQLGFF